MEIFASSDVSSLLLNRFVVVIGDSIQRGIYKDLVLLLQKGRYLTPSEQRSKGETSFLDDSLIEGGCKGVMSNGISYKEVRQYKTDVHLVRFYFVTRCYNQYVETILSDLKKEPQPDVVIMNSCLWDITRYGMDSIVDYKDNMQKLFERFSNTLPSDCLVIWNTTLPIASSARGGFLVPEIEFMTTTLRLDILEANFYARQVAADHGFDVLDLHFYLRHHINQRVQDGVHWDQYAHRRITNLILNHICQAWEIPLPKRTPITFGSYGSVAAQTRPLQHQTQYDHNRGVMFKQQNINQLQIKQKRNINCKPLMSDMQSCKQNTNMPSSEQYTTMLRLKQYRNMVNSQRFSNVENTQQHLNVVSNEQYANTQSTQQQQYMNMRRCQQHINQLSSQQYAYTQNSQQYANMHNSQQYAIMQNSQQYAIMQNSQQYAIMQNSQQHTNTQSSQLYMASGQGNFQFENMQDNFQFTNGNSDFHWQPYQQNSTGYTTKKASIHDFSARHQPYGNRRH